MQRLLLTVSAAVLGATVGLAPALAQDGVTGAQQEMTGSSASDVTCRQLESMDAAMIPGLLYFVDGYAQAEKAGGVGSGSGDQVGNQETVQAGAEAGDMSTWSDFVYVASVDAYARRIIGWRVSRTAHAPSC